MLRDTFRAGKVKPILEEDSQEKARVLYVACDWPIQQAFYEKDPQMESKDGMDRLSPDSSRVRTIPPNSEPFRYRLGYALGTPRRSTDWASFAFAGLTAGVRLLVEAPDDLVIGVYPSRGNKNNNRWDFDDVFMKGQHITVYWRPQSVESPSVLLEGSQGNSSPSIIPKD